MELWYVQISLLTRHKFSGPTRERASSRIVYQLSANIGTLGHYLCLSDTSQTDEGYSSKGAGLKKSLSKLFRHHLNEPGTIIKLLAAFYLSKTVEMIHLNFD
jgi:hypothetical protein